MKPYSYLDNAATTPLYPELVELMHELNRELFANPSSLHSLGRKSKKELEKARASLAALLSAEASEVFFCSGATEANNTVFKLLDYDYIVTSPAEHSCVIEAAKSLAKPIHWLNLDSEGFVDILELEAVLKQASTQYKKILVSIMHGNNEIGTVNDIGVIAETIKKISKAGTSKIFFHSDCVQTFTKHEINLSKLDIDFITASAHKIHGPKGIALLYLNKRVQEDFALELSPLIVGGNQEENLRSGTENVIGAIAFAKAAELNSRSENRDKIRALQEYFLEQVSNKPGFVLNGPKALDKRVLGNLNFALTNCRLNSEELVLQLDLLGIAVSSGSACSSNKNPNSASILSSYVLRSCKIAESIAVKSIRVSISSMNTVVDIEQLIKQLFALDNKFTLRH